MQAESIAVMQESSLRSGEMNSEQVASLGSPGRDFTPEI